MALPLNSLIMGDHKVKQSLEEWDRFVDGIDAIGKALVQQKGLTEPQDKYEIIFSALQAYETIEPEMIEINKRNRERAKGLRIVE